MTFLRTYMPEIAWFDSRAPILAVDIQQVDVPKERVREFERDTERYYKLATVSTQSDVRIWDFCFGRDGQLFTDFIANLEGHNGTVNCCKFSPNGEMLATGDTFGALLVWYHSDEPLPPAPLDDYELPPNRENWKQQKKIKIRHDSDVTCVAWSPNSQFIASGSNDDSVSVFDVVNGKRLWMIRNFRHFPVGLAWDPRGKFLMSLSTDRRFDIIEATKGKQLRTAYAVEGLETKFGSNVESHATGQYKLYHDSQLAAFSRTMDFSPCGELLFTPTAHIEIGESNVYGTYVYERADFDKCRPSAMLPSTKPTILVRCSPVVYKLRESVKTNYLGLPYRVIYAVMTKDSITLHDSQFSVPIAYTDNLHYDVLTSLAWTPDGTTFTVSSQEGYNTFVTNFAKAIGEPMPLPPASETDVVLEQPKAKRVPKKEKENISASSTVPASAIETPKAVFASDGSSTPISIDSFGFSSFPLPRVFLFQLLLVLSFFAAAKGCPLRCVCRDLYISCNNASFSDVLKFIHSDVFVEVKLNATAINGPLVLPSLAAVGLSLNFCNITALHSDSFSHIKGLRFVNIDYNSIETIPEMNGLDRVQYFSGKSNYIHEVHVNAFKSAKQLSFLNLNSNHLNNINFLSSVSSTLTVASMYKNMIQKVHVNGFVKLELLDLNGNFINRPASAIFTNNPELQHVLLSHNGQYLNGIVVGVNCPKASFIPYDWALAYSDQIDTRLQESHLNTALKLHANTRWYSSQYLPIGSPNTSATLSSHNCLNILSGNTVNVPFDISRLLNFILQFRAKRTPADDANYGFSSIKIEGEARTAEEFSHDQL